MKLKKLLILTLCLATLAGISTPALAAQETITVDPISIMVGGKEFLPTDPNGDNALVFVYNGTTYAPLRALAEAYGLTVGYDHEKLLASVEGTPSGSFAGTNGTMQVPASRMTISIFPINIVVNGTVFQPKDPNGKDALVFTYNGTTYAPLRALAEAYGLTVGYDSEKHLATVEFKANTGIDFYSLLEEVSAERKAKLLSSTVFEGYNDYLVDDPSASNLVTEQEKHSLFTPFGSDIALLPHELPVYLDGVQTANFTVTSSDPTGCAVSRSSDGYLLLTATVPGYYGITVRCGETERTFVWFADERYES